MESNRITDEYITTLGPDEVFVFGSNLHGYHGGGAAAAAHRRFVAVRGQGVGLQGQSYAIPTMQGGVETIKPYVDEFIGFENIALPEVRRKLEETAASAVPENRPGDHNQAVMDLGATICVPGTPDCARCPLSAFCNAFSRGDAADLPILPRPVPQKTLHWTVPVLRSGNRILVRCRTESLLRGLWCFPMLNCGPEEAGIVLRKRLHLNACSAGNSCSARHVFTHLIWYMEILPMETDPGLPAPPGYRWVSTHELDTLAFPSAMSIPLQTAHTMLSV